MKAAVMKDWELRVDEVADPVPQAGQVLTRVLACGICGSDLHMLRHGKEAQDLSATFDADQPRDPMAPKMFEPHIDTVMGHEFCCEVVDLGEGCDNLKIGDLVVSMPGAFDADGVHTIGYSNRYPGGYGERMVLNELLCLKVPNGLTSDLAALTEPLAVGVHAVAKSRIANGDSAIVLGCGPVGLACIADMKMRGIGPVVAADYSPARRALAVAMGADEVVDPAAESAMSVWRRVDGVRPLVIFEAVGVPGMIDQAMRMAPRGSRILVVGACMQQDRMFPMLGITRELSLQFVLGYEPAEFAGALRSIAEGDVDLSAWITATVSIADVPRAFDDLAEPERHVKILVTPGEAAVSP
jgi:threonine dehydrogenase-like Zn-dependent dehydrogenase